MSTIRKDFVGAVYINGLPLYAGDAVPEGADISSALVEDSTPDAPGRNAPKREWVDFLVSQGVDVPEDATRNELRELWGE